MSRRDTNPTTPLLTLATSRLSRRSLLVRAGALGAGALFAAPLLAACGSGDDDDDDDSGDPTATGGGGAATATGGAGAPTATTAAASTPSDAGEPVSGGKLILGYTEPPTMDPRVSGATIAWRLFYNLFDPLVAQDTATGDFLPGLATTWAVSEDGMIYTFDLVEGAKFHDGSPFNAEAVKFTWDSTLEPELKSLTAIGYLGPYGETVVLDEFTVETHFTAPYAPFLNNLSHSVLSPVSPTAVEKFGIDFGFNPVGTGPFMFKEWKPQISMTFVKNPDYAWPLGVYTHEGPAFLDEIEVKFIPEASTILGTLENGETTMIDGVPPQEVERIKNDENFQVLLPSVPGSPQILPLNCVRPPTDELAVRQAINYAIDMDTIIDTLWYGSRKVASGPLSSPTWTYNPAVETMFPYDPEMAAKLLDEAGWTEGSGGVREKNGEKLHLAFITVTGIQGQAAELVQAYLTEVGMEVDLQQLEYAATASAYLASEHNIARIYFSHTDPVVLTTLYHTKNIEGTNFNRTMIPDEALDKMLDDATAEMDPDARKTQYEAIQQYIMDDARIIPLWEETVFWGASAKVQGLHFQPLGGVWFYDTWMQE